MGERMFDFSPAFQSPEAALLGKARYFQMGSETSKQEVQKQEAQSFEPSDFLVLNDDESDESSSQEILVKPEEDGTPSPRMVSPKVSGLQSGNSTASQSKIPKANLSSRQKSKKRKSERAARYAFKTRSESDNLEDGYKWRKYGKKFVKNNPNPRNYYRCSYSNCNVKKRVERDAHDDGVVITTYEGKHNHETSTVIYYIGKPSMLLPQQVSSFEQYPPLCYPTRQQADFMILNNT